VTSTRLFWPAVGSGCFAALLLPGRPAGLGVAVAGLAVIGVAIACTRPRDPWRLACWGAAAALAVIPALRAAAWVVVLSLLAAVVLGSLAASGAQSWRGVVAGALGWLGQLVPGLALLAVRAVPAGGARWGPAARGASLTAVLLAVFAPLFVTADAAFAQIVGDAFDWDADLVPDRVAVFVLVAGLPLALALTGRTWVRPAAPLRLLGRTEWLIALAALDALFAGFVALQLTTLFGGDRHVLQTAGLTYAEYAHQGFGQLMAAAALTLAVIALARRDSPVLTLLLGLLCALTLVVLASALKRLELYEEAFGFTRLRLLAHAAILWLGALFVLIVAAGVLKRTRRLPRATVALSAAAALAFALANPDARIAEHNIKRFEHTGQIDRAYLRHLSADAAPALIRAGEGHKPKPEPDGILSTNLGRARARAAIRSAG
jgi:Domain of unknown function (DUF4173)